MIVATVLGTGLLFILIIATIGLLLGPPDDEPTPMVGSTVAPDPGDTAERPTSRSAPFGTVAQTGDADRFAESAALAVFAWDTRDGYQPTDYVQAMLDQASDPANEETDGLATDLAAYVPNRAAWIELQRYETREHLVIDQIGVPDTWAEVERQAREGTLLPGTIAYTVDGTRHRTGVWEGKEVATDHPVAFTMFIACEPTYEQCRLLRLTVLDKPLR